MTQKLVTLLLIIFLLLAVSFATFANGDKVQGDRGQGEVHQVQVQP